MGAQCNQLTHTLHHQCSRVSTHTPHNQSRRLLGTSIANVSAKWLPRSSPGPPEQAALLEDSLRAGPAPEGGGAEGYDSGGSDLEAPLLVHAEGGSRLAVGSNASPVSKYGSCEFESPFWTASSDDSQEAPYRLAAAKSAPLLGPVGRMHTIIEVSSNLSRASSGVPGEVSHVYCCIEYTMHCNESQLMTLHSSATCRRRARRVAVQRGDPRLPGSSTTSRSTLTLASSQTQP